MKYDFINTAAKNNQTDETVYLFYSAQAENLFGSVTATVPDGKGGKKTVIFTAQFDAAPATGWEEKYGWSDKILVWTGKRSDFDIMESRIRDSEESLSMSPRYLRPPASGKADEIRRLAQEMFGSEILTINTGKFPPFDTKLLKNLLGNPFLIKITDGNPIKEKPTAWPWDLEILRAEERRRVERESERIFFLAGERRREQERERDRALLLAEERKREQARERDRQLILAEERKRELHKVIVKKPKI